MDRQVAAEGLLRLLSIILAEVERGGEGLTEDGSVLDSADDEEHDGAYEYGEIVDALFQLHA